MYLGEQLGVEVDHSTKCHPEMAGEVRVLSTLGVEQNRCIKEPS
jgi:hypothetical protein